jgi:hypothetical protein
LADQTEITVVAIHERGDITICDTVRHHWRVPDRLIDFGKEWRFECPWLPESHPKVLEHLDKLLVQLRAKPPHPVPVMNRGTEDAIKHLVFTIERHRGPTPAPD